jgi:hypothetical protein
MEGEEGRGEEKRRNQSGNQLIQFHSSESSTAYRTNVSRFTRLQITVLRVPGKEEEYLHRPPEHHPAGRKILHRVGTALAPPVPIVSSPLLRFHTGSWSFSLGPEW